MKFKPAYLWIMAMSVLLLHSGQAWAAFGEDLEKPRPEFSQEGGDWIAKLIPRGKSVSIQIRFHAEEAAIERTVMKEFREEEMPLVNWKNFRSDFFAVILTPAAPGAEVSLTISSDYFTTATELWGPASVNAREWATTGAVNVGLANRVNALTVKLRDGGPLDADGKTDGRIEFIFGPRDSFWGYAMGTLFIRFFGIFIVLGVLMIGMLFSGRVFQWIDTRKLEKEIAVPPSASTPEIPDTSVDAYVVDPAAVAAIAVALHLRSGAADPKPFVDLSAAASSTWSRYGRGKLMDERMPVFSRSQQK